MLLSPSLEFFTKRSEKHIRNVTAMKNSSGARGWTWNFLKNPSNCESKWIFCSILSSSRQLLHATNGNIPAIRVSNITVHYTFCWWTWKTEIRGKEAGKGRHQWAFHGSYSGILIWPVLPTFITMKISTFVEPHISTTFMTLGLLAWNWVSSS